MSTSTAAAFLQRKQQAAALGEKPPPLDDFLTEMRHGREDKAALERVSARLDALHRLPAAWEESAEQTAEERQQLDALLACVRQAAEREVDARMRIE